MCVCWGGGGGGIFPFHLYSVCVCVCVSLFLPPYSLTLHELPFCSRPLFLISPFAEVVSYLELKNIFRRLSFSYKLPEVLTEALSVSFSSS